MSENIVKYKAEGQEISLSPSIIRKYLVSGNATVTDQEIMMFTALCKFQRLNPFLREVYLIKYASDMPASMVVGKEAFLKRAAKNDKYAGHETGISEDGKTAWAKVYMHGNKVPIKCEVDYDEYVGKTKAGKINRMWREKPRTMLKKVALCQSLRESLPADLGGMYSAEEINTVQSELLPSAHVEKSDIPNSEQTNGENDDVPDFPVEPAPSDDRDVRFLNVSPCGNKFFSKKGQYPGVICKKEEGNFNWHLEAGNACPERLEKFLPESFNEGKPGEKSETSANPGEQWLAKAKQMMENLAETTHYMDVLGEFGAESARDIVNEKDRKEVWSKWNQKFKVMKGEGWGKET